MTTTDTLLVISGFAQAFGTIAVALVLKNQADKFKKIELFGQATNALNFVNATAVANPEI